MQRKSPFICRPLHRAAGFSLVEVLVSVFVLSIGLIGTGMIQLNAFRTTEQSSFHSTAQALAMQIADEMRANDAQMRLPAGANPFENLNYSAESGAPAAANGPNCYSGVCTSAQWASHSKQDWQRKVFEGLPGGRLQICRDANVVGAAGSSFQWCDAGGGGAAGNAPVVVKIGWFEKDPDGTLVADNSPRIALLVSPFTQ